MLERRLEIGEIEYTFVIEVTIKHFKYSLEEQAVSCFTYTAVFIHKGNLI